MKNIYQHFRPEEKVFIDRSIDMINRVVDNYITILTDFINPREYKILESLANAEGIQIFSSRVVSDTEMVRVILAPDYYLLDTDDFELSLVEINFSSKFSNIKHSQILGTLLGQTGLDRSKIGDILVSKDRAQVFIEEKFSNLLAENISKIGHLGVKLKQVPMSNLINSEESHTNIHNKILVVSSIRLDKIIASAFNISRSVASSLIEKGLVKVNYTVIEKKDFSLDSGDLISIRGYGRVTLGEKLSVSKKDKVRIEVKITKNK